MEETVLVIMLRDPITGFLEKELGSYAIGDGENLIYNAYAQVTNDGLMVFIKLTVDREIEDWEFNAIYDYYDEAALMAQVVSFREEEDAYDPTWVVTFPFLDNVPDMEEKIRKILKIHKQELDSVYEAIVDQKDAYTSHEDE